MTNRFYGDHLVAQDVDSMNITPYCKLKKVEYNGEMLLLYRKDGGGMLRLPDGDTVLEPGSNVVVIAHSGDRETLRRFFR